MGTDAVAGLLDRQAITEAVYRYCRVLDRMDRDGALALWHPGATADYRPFFQGSGVDFVDWVWKQHEAMTGHSHQITNILISLDGDTATSESYVTVVLHASAEGGRVSETVVRGRYLDRWSRRDGRWALDARRHVADLQTVTVHDAAMVPDPSPAQGGGSRDRTDPSYQLID